MKSATRNKSSRARFPFLFHPQPNLEQQNTFYDSHSYFLPISRQWNLYNICHEATENTTSSVAIGDKINIFKGWIKINKTTARGLVVQAITNIQIVTPMKVACREGEIFSSERSHRKKFSRHLEFFMQWKTGERKKGLTWRSKKAVARLWR